MKRLIAFATVFLLLFSMAFAAKKPKVLNVTVTAELLSNDKVGSDWVIVHTINEQVFFKDTNTAKKPGTDSVMVMDGGKLCIKTEVTEEDKDISDYAIVETERIISSSDLKNGFTIVVEVTVVENGGRYSGRTAVWEITYEFKP